jgi:hypothetical protein
MLAMTLRIKAGHLEDRCSSLRDEYRQRVTVGARSLDAPFPASKPPRKFKNSSIPLDRCLKSEASLDSAQLVEEHCGVS